VTTDRPEPQVRQVPLGELLARQQRVMDAAVAFIDNDAAFIRARTSGVHGAAVAAARAKRDDAKDELRDAVKQLRSGAATS
jgi:hypothetical protein